ncbi:hypothetical protein FKM82_024520 [Ascaphus truei]
MHGSVDETDVGYKAGWMIQMLDARLSGGYRCWI